MQHQLHDILEDARQRNSLPAVVAYNRIDGPGSSLDLREFQQAFWSMPEYPSADTQDDAAAWTRALPRTVGITINTGTRIQALPYEPGKIAVKSIEYSTEVAAVPGTVVPNRENWLLKIMELFALSGVQFVLHNLRPGTQSSGLGGSATATTGVCVLANELTGRRFSPVQLVSMASRIEQDLGVSLTGTQEQSNVLFGGVTDYVWFPWGIPDRSDGSYGESVRRMLLAPSDYRELECRMAIFHTGIRRASTDVNAVWMHALLTAGGYQRHGAKLEIAYGFAEGLRRKQWDQVLHAVREYRKVRTDLCKDYMAGAGEMNGFAEEKGCAAFPLGAGGGGGVLIFGPDPQALRALREELATVYREIPYRIMPKGHELENLPI
jgi:galactokinase/mevalonate kinase-like predicted kinase